ncbi:hypothetical protein ACFQFC_16085 [Amorphoplanes digitatis]|uniref:Uncharacterized protein n=1 Tax=Actinoplanes digitatis TaxID=1868 RepID=A0A7W7I3J4_9ACTN|nr:hypothetical protein [Actinoplanes digitatis]MBB4765731.1 hypothetical protein [Actinoplanes digitatis]GID98488.1 hypothetical protein Adi01nite_79000 [Actinoplanes digitatis]
MFSRRNTAERTAAQAWDYLSSAMSTAGEGVMDAGRHTADLAGTGASAAGAHASRLTGRAGRRSSRLAHRTARRTSRLADRAGTALNAVSDEAWARANLAANALAGRRPGLPWGLIVGAGLIGAALGWTAASTAQAALRRQAENEELERAETAMITTPAYDN